MQIPLNSYLAILRSSEVDGPFATHEKAEVLSPAFAKFATALADFVDVANAELDGGYEETRANLEAVFHTFPVTATPEGDESLEALLALLAASPSAEEPGAFKA